MSSNDPQTRREREFTFMRAWNAAGCQPCTPGRARAAKRVAEQQAETGEEPATAAPAAPSTAHSSVSGEQHDEVLATPFGYGCCAPPAAEAPAAPRIV
jgi:hypothetical protein